MIFINVDEKKISCEEGRTLLDVCLENGIYIPNLCHVKGMQTPPASCRMCMVAIDGEKKPAMACTTRVRENMTVMTDTPEIRHLQRTALRLLLSVHDIDCKNCSANKHCELQNLSRFLKVGLKAAPYATLLKETAIDRTHPCLDYYPNRCLLCGKCIHVCRQKNGQSVFTFARRGFKTVISTFGFDNPDVFCGECLACVEICPVGALVVRKDAVNSNQKEEDT
ncbi:MAG: (2Fe-2S)-binding protein [Deltaproteobacteria bacterium]|nr:(2Fe-2S)-binding protein [Deltaproteobacteria bacterium]